MRLTDFKVLTFDCYGTLIDWESGIVEALRPLLARRSGPLTRDEILEAHARHESHQQRFTPEMNYSQVLGVVYRRLAEEWGVEYSQDEMIAYGQSVGVWPAFPDSTGALLYLKKYFKVAILSNIDNTSFAQSQKLLDVEFDVVITAEDVGAYKPAKENFEYMLATLDNLGFKKEEILHTAESMYHDHTLANKIGLPSCWIYRRFEQKGFGATMDPGLQPQVNFQFTSMAQLVRAHQDELRKG